MFLPTTRDEVKQRGWDQLDVILVSGDTYIDTSYNGIIRCKKRQRLLFL